MTQTYLNKTGADNTTISKFVSPYNIVPTLMDLLGYKYDKNIFMGSSVFSDDLEVFYSIKLTGFFDYNMYSNNGIDIIYSKQPYSDEEYRDFINQCLLLKTKIGYVNKIYVTSRTKIES